MPDSRLIQIFKDPRGHLFEAFRQHTTPVAMAYVVQTEPGYGRDLQTWHVHKEKAETFVCVAGAIMLAVRYSDSDLAVYTLTDNHPKAITVRRGEFHSVFNHSDKPATLLVLCDNLYDPEDEGRVPMAEFQWKK
jgi:dTDP-4-dehydrorhamnose 3,5-epimerase-like enzyme